MCYALTAIDRLIGIFLESREGTTSVVISISLKIRVIALVVINAIK